MEIIYKIPDELEEYLKVIHEDVLNILITRCIKYSIAKRGNLDAPEVQQTVVPDMSEILEKIVSLESLVSTRQVAVTEVAPKPLPKPKPKIVRPEVVTTPDGFGDADDELDFLMSIVK